MRINETINGVRLRIDLENGVYSFYSMSAAGKTRAFKLLSEADNISAECITYRDTHNLKKVELDETKDIIFLDRFDMYADKVDKRELEKAGISTVVILDSKEELVGIDYSYTEIFSLETEVVIGNSLHQ